MALLKSGDLAAGLTAIRRSIELEPAYADAHVVAGKLLLAMGHPQRAVPALKHAVSLSATNGDAYHMLGIALQRLERFGEAVTCHRQATELAPGDAGLQHHLAAALFQAGDVIGAADSFRAAVEIDPDFAAAWNGLGMALRAQGDFAGAIAGFNRAIALQPDFGEAHRNLSTCVAQPPAQGIVQLIRIVDDPAVSMANRIGAAYAAGKWLDDARNYDEAFHWYARANEMSRQHEVAEGSAYDHAALQTLVTRTRYIFNREFLSARQDWGNQSQVPVFIVGHFRSGTTLVEQIVASHSHVFGAGELPDLRSLSRLCGEPPDKAATWQPRFIEDSAAAHLQKLQTLAPNYPRVVDKNPDNIFALGLIATLFPKARIIFCHRDARDVALSCFMQRFTLRQSFASDLADCGRRYLLTQSLLDHWGQSLSNPMLHVYYESLVEDLATQAGLLIDFLGLEWDDQCLEFYKGTRQVNTASTWQVHQPLYATSVHRWRNYSAHLQPLYDVLRQRS